MSRLTWAAAWPLIDSLFVARPATWPRRLTPLHLAWLQLPDAPGRMKRAAADAIEQACADGELPSEIAPFELGNPEYRFRISGPAPWVLAADFLAWLRKERAEPSVHVKAWAEATGGSASAAPSEKPEARRERLRSELKREKASGVRNPAQRVAEREGITPGRLRHIIGAGSARVARPAPAAWYPAAASAQRKKRTG